MSSPWLPTTKMSLCAAAGIVLISLNLRLISKEFLRSNSFKSTLWFTIWNTLVNYAKFPSPSQWHQWRHNEMNIENFLLYPRVHVMRSHLTKHPTRRVEDGKDEDLSQLSWPFMSRKSAQMIEATSIAYRDPWNSNFVMEICWSPTTVLLKGSVIWSW
jgi:hypothetical protein